jgi:hypothetical protein
VINKQVAAVDVPGKVRWGDLCFSYNLPSFSIAIDADGLSSPSISILFLFPDIFEIPF